MKMSGVGMMRGIGITFGSDGAVTRNIAGIDGLTHGQNGNKKA
jgi:hypothetical protein